MGAVHQLRLIEAERTKQTDAKEHEYPTCYVCGRPILKNPQRIPTPPGQPPLYRHRSKCYPGSKEYLKKPGLRRRWKRKA